MAAFPYYDTPAIEALNSQAEQAVDRAGLVASVQALLARGRGP